VALQKKLDTYIKDNYDYYIKTVSEVNTNFEKEKTVFDVV